MNFQISDHRTALTSVHFITKSGTLSLLEKAKDANDLGGVGLMCGELEWNTTTVASRGADVSMPAFEPQEDILTIHHHIK